MVAFASEAATGLKQQRAYDNHEDSNTAFKIINNKNLAIQDCMSSNATPSSQSEAAPLNCSLHHPVHSTQVKRSITKLYFISSVMLTRQSIKVSGTGCDTFCPYRCSYCMAWPCIIAWPRPRIASHRTAPHRTASHLGNIWIWQKKVMFLLGFCNCVFVCSFRLYNG